jgi:hypothetical protein
MVRTEQEPLQYFLLSGFAIYALRRYTEGKTWTKSRKPANQQYLFRRLIHRERHS